MCAPTHTHTHIHIRAQKLVRSLTVHLSSTRPLTLTDPSCPASFYFLPSFPSLSLSLSLTLTLTLTITISQHRSRPRLGSTNITSMALRSRSMLSLHSPASLVLLRSTGPRQPIQRLPSFFNSISLASSSSSPRSLLSFSSLSLSPSSSPALFSLSRSAVRSFSTSLSHQTPRPGLLKKKKLGKYPWRNFKKVKTHSGCKVRFKSYKNGTFKHIKAGQNQKNIKDNAAKRHVGSVKILCGPMQTRKLKKLMPYWKRTRRGGGW